MPIRIPDPPDPFRMMNQLAQLRQFANQQEQQRQNQANKEATLFLQAAGNRDVNLADLAGAFPTLTAQTFKAGQALQAATKKGAAREEQRQTATGPLAEIFAQRGSAQAPAAKALPPSFIGPRPQAAPVEHPSVAAFRERSREKGVAEDVIERHVGLARLGGEAIQAMERRDANKEYIENAATRVAGSQLGFGGESLDVILADGRQLFSPEEWPDIRAKIMNAALAKVVDERLAAQTPTGRSDLSLRAEAMAGELGYTKRQALLIVPGDAFPDPVTGHVVPTVSAQWEASRYALAEIQAAYPDLVTAAEGAARARRDRGAWVGPVVGAPAIQELRRLFGLQDPDVAEYELEYRTMVSRILKAIQGSRPSDFDLHFYLGLLPQMTEIFLAENGELNPAARRRLDVLGRQFRRAANTVTNPKLAREAERLRAIPKTAADKAIERAARRYQDGQIDGVQFTEELEKWKQSPGRFRKQAAEERRGKGLPARSVDPNNPSAIVDDLLEN